jgi:hypothetical protein
MILKKSPSTSAVMRQSSSSVSSKKASSLLEAMQSFKSKAV